MTSKTSTRTSSKTTFLLTGASGNTGGYAAKALAAARGRSGRKIIALVRDEAKGEALLKSSGVDEYRVADGDKKRTLKEAFAGVDVALLIPPNGGKTWRYRKGVIDNYVEAAREAGVRRVVLLSFWLGEADSIFHKQMVHAEEDVKAFPEWLIVRAPLFMDNYMLQVQAVKGGKFQGVGGARATTPMVAISDVGEAMAAALTSHSTGAEYRVVTDKRSNKAIADAFADVLDRAVKYEEIDVATLRAAFSGAGMPKWQIDGILEIVQTINELEVNRDFQKLTKKEPKLLEDWIADNAKAFGGKAARRGKGTSSGSTESGSSEDEYSGGSSGAAGSTDDETGEYSA